MGSVGIKGCDLMTPPPAFSFQCPSYQVTNGRSGVHFRSHLRQSQHHPLLSLRIRDPAVVTCAIVVMVVKIFGGWLNGGVVGVIVGAAAVKFGATAVKVGASASSSKTGEKSSLPPPRGTDEGILRPPTKPWY